MDTSKKHIKDLCSCKYCMYYKANYKNGKKICKGKCNITGKIKNRTDKCKKYFKNNRTLSLFELNDGGI